MAPTPNPNLIEVFKASNPNEKLLADPKQLLAKGGKLVRWSDREAFLKGGAKGKAPAKGGKGKPAGGEDAPGETSEPEAPAADAAEVRAALEAEAVTAGVTIHHKMSNDTIRKKIDEAKAKA
jgi:hypothetical protein